MRKQELVHLHGLLVVIRGHLAEREDVEIPAGAFDVYDSYGVEPTAISERKDAHKEAVDRLLAGLHTTLAATREGADSPDRSTDSVDPSATR